MAKRKSQYKPLLFTTTVRSPERIKEFLSVLKEYDGEILTNEIIDKVVRDLINGGVYTPNYLYRKRVFYNKLKRGANLSSSELTEVIENSPQNHKEAGFDKGWPSRFDTWYKFPRELGFVYYAMNEKIKLSEIGIKLVEKPEFERKAFLNAFAKYQRNNPFRRILNENIPLVLLLEVIGKLNEDEKFNGAGISKLELPLVIFWKNNDSEGLYKLIKDIRKKHGYEPSWEVIVDICVNKIMESKFKKFNPKSIMVDYPDEFIRKMRLTGIISLRGGGRFVDINRKEQEAVDYILKNYSSYKKYRTEKDFYEYMAKVDKELLKLVTKPIDLSESEKYLRKWVSLYVWEKIKKELIILARKKLSKDDILKYLSNSIRLEFLVALAIKKQLPDVRVIPNYPYDDEGLPTSTAGGIGDKGDIECFEDINGVLVEVTMSEGRTQTVMEVWPITRHLEKFSKEAEQAMCYFVAPSIYKDSIRQIDFVREKEKFNIVPKTIEEFIEYLDCTSVLYCNM